MVKLVKQKVLASTLIEVLIAMVIIIGVFAIAISIFGNILKTGPSLKKLQVQNQLNSLTKQVVKSPFVDYKVVEIDSVLYEIVQERENTGRLIKLEISAKQQDTFIGKIKLLYLTYEKN